MAAKLFAVTLVALLASSTAQLSPTAGSDLALGTLFKFGRNTASRLAANGAANLAAGVNLASTAVNATGELVNAGVGVKAGLNRGITQLATNGAKIAANVARQLTGVKRGLLETGIRVGQDAAQTGLNIAARGINAIGLGAVGNPVLNATSTAVNRVANLKSNIVRSKVNLIDRVINATENTATRVGSNVDRAIEARARNVQGLIYATTGTINGGLNLVGNGGAGAISPELNLTA